MISYVYVFSACGYGHMSDHAQQDQRDPLELELQTVVNHWCGCWGYNPGPLGETFWLLSHLSRPLNFMFFIFV